jgi:D-beta-D-heptose 7-phosphate kinase/D-beta-D-heptose 1-phosphate adenosyltransferase
MDNAHSFLARLPVRPGPILVVGDLICDHYVWGDVERISPEAPVQVLRWDGEADRAGGAANAAMNLAALGCQVHLAGMVGDDEPGARLLKIVQAAGIDTSGVIVSKKRPTSLKTRVIARGQHVLRIDRETRDTASPAEEGRVVKTVRGLSGQVSGVVCSDYAKGVLTKEVLKAVIGLERRPFVVVDPKGRDFSKYRGANILTPNERELMEALPDTDPRLHEDGVVARRAKTLIQKFRLRALLVTRGANGMDLFESGRQGIRRTHIPPSHERQVFDVTGAGDTVAAVLMLGVAGGLPLVDAARIANVAAGLVVGIVGTAVPDPDTLLQMLSQSRHP